MNRQLPFLATAFVLALAAGAAGVSFTGELESVVTDIEARQVEFRAQGDAAGRRSARVLGRAARFLKRRSASRSLVGEISGAKRAAGLVEARFPDEAGILGGLNDAAGVYEQQVALNTLVLESQTQQTGLRRARQRALQRKLTRAQAGLTAASEAETLKQRLAAYLRVARASKNATLTGEDRAWVVATLSVADRADAIGNHKLADAADVFDNHGLDLDALLQNAVFMSPNVFVIELWAVDDFAADSLVFAAALEAADTDGNTSDNFSGSEEFFGALEIDGHGVVRTATALASGAYDIELSPTAPLTLAGIAVEGGETLRIVATASDTTNSGHFVLTVNVGELLELVGRAGEEIPPDLITDLTALADVDTDGDEQPDALSATLAFSTARATVTRPQ